MKALRLNTDGPTSRNSIIVNDEGFICGNPNLYQFREYKNAPSFLKPAHFLEAEARRIVVHLNGLIEDPDTGWEITGQVEKARRTPDIRKSEFRSAKAKNADIYQRNGFADRETYLRNLAAINKVTVQSVFSMASMLGKEEDFDALVSSIEDMAWMGLK